MTKEKIKNIFKNIFAEDVRNIDTIGGMTNNNYLVVTDKKKYILKFFGKGTNKLISREIEKKNMQFIKTLGLDVENYVFDIEQGIKINEYIENATTYDEKIIKTKFESVAKILQKVHSSTPTFHSSFDVFREITKYEDLIEGEITYSYYDKITPKVLKLKDILDGIGIDNKNCHIDLVPENFIESKEGRTYLIDWEYCAINDPMWDLAALFLESNFTKKEELEFLSIYRSDMTPINLEKIHIYKILQDFLWSLWTLYKEENGANFDTYGNDRYTRMLKTLKEYKEIYEK